MTTIEILWLISSMLGGLALFLSGMSTMSDSLAAMTGGSLNRLIGKVTKNRLLAFLFGTVMTALVQSASATTVLTVGLVNSGMIEFSKAIGLIIGRKSGNDSDGMDSVTERDRRTVPAHDADQAQFLFTVPGNRKARWTALPPGNSAWRFSVPQREHISGARHPRKNASGIRRRLSDG